MSLPTADELALMLVFAASPPLTLFVLLYPFLARGWWRRLVGHAIMISTTGLMLLVNLSMAFMVLGDDDPYRDIIRNTVYSIIVLGAWAKFLALVIINGRVFRNTYVARRLARMTPDDAH